MQIDKFPKLSYQGRFLIWDSRQAACAQEWVFVPENHIEPVDKKALLSRSNASFVRERGSGAEVEVDDVRWALGRMAALACEDKSTQLRVIAVTGTNGKTTTCAVMRHLLVDMGENVVELGTLGCRLYKAEKGQVPVEQFDLGFTTPLAPQLHLLIQKAVEQGYKYVVMEASSQGIELGRLAGVHLSGALYLNLTQDHLDFHGTMEEYGKARLRLFTELLKDSKAPQKIAVINQDGSLSAEILRQVSKDVASTSIVAGETYVVQPLGTRGQRIQFKDGFTLDTTMMGAHNAQNIVTAFEALRMFGYPREALQKSLAQFFGAKGRLERVSDLSSPCQVFVDYAHTPDALEKILSSLRQVAPTTFLTCVFGCGGDRDAAKRPIMGRIAVTMADKVYLTADNSRSEDTSSILRDIQSGISVDKLDRVVAIADRSKAIGAAISEAKQKSGIVLIAGKGHEEYRILDGKRFDFSDQKVAREFLLRS